MSDTGALGGTETLLVVDDERPVLDLIGDVLRLQGYTVLVAAEGDEALRAADGHHGPLHLVILDAVIPGLTSAEVLERLRAARPDIKVLYISGYTGDLISQLLQVGHSFLQKPFTVDALLRKVREVLDGPRPT